VAFLLAGLSVLLWLIAVVLALTKGFRHYDPTLIGFYAWGFLTGSLGVFVGPFGKGKLRWPAFGVSMFMALLWFSAAYRE
jgi:hypothetical protein